MSLIMDATKAAQREKERREGGANSGKVPLLVPLRSKGASRFNWQRVLMFTGAGVAVLLAGWFALQRSRDTVPLALRTPGPSIASLATPAETKTAAQDTAPTKEVSRGAAVAKAPNGAARRATEPVQRRTTKVASRPTPGPRVVSGSASGADRSGGLHIEVDQPRAAEVARLFALGVAAQRAGDATTARAAYERLLILAPNDVDALNNLGVLLTDLRELDRAETALRRALSRAPSNAGAWSNLGAVLRDRGRPAEAIAMFQHALSLDSHHAGAQVGLAQQYLAIGSLAQARQALNSVLRDNPASPEANYALGQVLERQGDRAGAIGAFNTFIRVAPPSLAPYVEGVRRHVESLGAPTP